MIKVIPHGYLSDLLPAEFPVEASTPAEAIKALSQFESFQPDPRRGRHQIETPNHTAESLFQETDQEALHIYPFFGGAGDGGFLQVAIGVAIVAAAVAIPGGEIAIAGATLSAGTIGLVGASIAIGGLLQMMSPAPGIGTGPGGGREDSFIIDSKKNTVELGTRIPIIYGRHRFGGHFLSFDVDAVEVDDEGDVLDPGTPPPIEQLSGSCYTKNKTTSLSWMLPSDSDINNFTTTNDLGAEVKPYTNGQDDIDRLEVRIARLSWKQEFGPKGDLTGNFIVNQSEFEKFSDINVQESLDLDQDTAAIYEIRVVYKDGRKSASVETGQLCLGPEPDASSLGRTQGGGGPGPGGPGPGG